MGWDGRKWCFRISSNYAMSSGFENSTVPKAKVTAQLPRENFFREIDCRLSNFQLDDVGMPFTQIEMT